MECTFGRPKYRFPPLEAVQEAIWQFVRETLAAGQVPVLQGYSLGKAQELLRLLHGLDLPVMVHKTVALMTEVVRAHLGPLPEWRLFEANEAAGHVLVFPPGTKPELPRCRFAMASGWALDSSAKYRYGVDAVFPLSDHADHAELLETVNLVRPRRIQLVHGFTREFAAELRRHGHDARALGTTDQLELIFEDRE
jgi:DNA ligase-1